MTIPTRTPAPTIDATDVMPIPTAAEVPSLSLRYLWLELVHHLCERDEIDHWRHCLPAVLWTLRAFVGGRTLPASLFVETPHHAAAATLYDVVSEECAAAGSTPTAALADLERWTAEVLAATVPVPQKGVS